MFISWCLLGKSIEIRLVGQDGPHPSQGRVEIRSADGVDNEWGTICNDQFEVDNKAATVLCRQLGYLWGEGTPNGVFGSASRGTPIWLDEVMCNGTETSLVQCINSGWGRHNCYHHEDVGAICHNASVRLQSLYNEGNVGVVQVMYDYKWGDVCDANWTDVSATIVCKQLGYVYGVAECCSALGTADFGNVDKLFNYSCSGVEQYLTQCSNVTDHGTCSYFHRASVVCHNTTKDRVNMDFDIRLSDGDDNWGRVEVRHSGIWGQICNNVWDEAAANVTCKQLGRGFIGGISFGPAVTTKEMPTWLVSVACTGKESSLENCNFTQWGEPLFFACSPAYVLCYKSSGVQLDIVDGTIPSTGRVQITYDGVPGSICATEEWTDNDAFLVCQMKGYSYGVVKTPSGSAVNVPPYYMNRLICSTLRDIFTCSSSGWRRNVDQCNLSAHVTCYKDIRLTDGNENAGIVEYIDNDKWVGFCNDGFTQGHAAEICKELDYQTGTLLPSGAYGKYYKSLGRPYIKCNGNESSILDCSYNTQITCSASRYNYVSISCHNDTIDTGPKYKLVGNDAEPTYGPVYVYHHHIWGEICSDGWTDIEADVYCKSLGHGFLGGSAVYYFKRPGIPNLVSEIKCKENESNFTPSLRLVDGGSNYGRVQISSDNVVGSVCDIDWTVQEANVVCREINVNFTQGEPYFDFPPSTDATLLENFECNGLETSLLKCLNAGWRSVLSSRCSDGSHKVGVYCYGKVRLMNGIKQRDIISGQVEILPVPGSGDGSDWLAVCGDGFNHTDALVICRELGFDAAKVLAPGSFGVKPLWKFYTNMSCTSEGNDIYTDCTYEKGICPKSTHNHASVQCYKSTLKPNTKFYIENIKHGQVIVEQYGINGTICDLGWDDIDADTLCKYKGYKGGVALGVPEIYTRTQTVWFTQVDCDTNSTSFLDCPMNDNVPVDCTMSLKTAGVLCHESDQPIRIELVNDENKPYYGRVEIVYDNKRGTICDYDWSTYDAQVTCRQLGYPAGQAYKKSYFGGGSGDVVLTGMTCDNSEKSILTCPNRGWNVKPSSCLDHVRDAGVKCKRNILTDEADNYGVVKVYVDGTYRLLCDDSFSHEEASWVCRNMGYSYGSKLCCSAFGRQRYALGVASLNCFKSNVKFSECETEFNNQCKTASDDYASVVCFNQVPEDGSDVTALFVSDNCVRNLCPDIDITALFVCGNCVRNLCPGSDITALFVCDNCVRNLCAGSGVTALFVCDNCVRNLCAGSDITTLFVCDNCVRNLCPGIDVTALFVCNNCVRNLCPGIDVTALFVCNNCVRNLCAGSDVTALFVCNNCVRNLCPGSAGSDVTALFVCNNCVRNLCPGSGVTALFVCDNCVRNLSPGSDVTALFVCDNCVRNLCAGSGVTALFVCDNCVRNLCAGSGVTALFVCDNCVRNLCAGSDVTALFVCDNCVRNLCPGSDVTALFVCDNCVRNLCPGSDVTALFVSDNCVRNLCPDSGVTALFVCGNCVRNLCPGSDVTALFVSDNCVRNLCPDSGVTALFVCDNCVRNLCAGSDVTALFVCDNCVRNLCAGSGVTALFVCDNCVRNLCAGSDVTALFVCDNCVRNLCAGSGVTALFVCGNCVRNLCPGSDVTALFVSDNCVRNLCPDSGVTALFVCDNCVRNLCAGSDVTALFVCDNCVRNLCAGSDVTALFVCFNVDIEEYRSGIGSGPVQIIHNNVKGYMCAENFDDLDANVICKQKGYTGGYAYKYYNEDVRLGATKDLRWMRGPDCTGTEHRLDLCPGINLYNISACFVLSHAAVFCYHNKEQGDFDVRLVNAHHPGEGFVQVKVNGTWGSVCTRSTMISNFEATVVCRQLNFNYGVVIPIPNYEMLNGTVWLSNINCIGSELAIRECLLSGMGDSISDSCMTHNYDLAVKCYANVRVSASTLPNYGMVQVLNETANRWVSVCDTDFDDVDAKVVCKNIGYKYGKPQCCSSLGTKLTFYNPIEVTNVKCNGTEPDFSKCIYDMGQNVTCPSGEYASVICTDDSPPSEGLEVRIQDNTLYGNVEVNRYGVWGSVCDVGWDHIDARVLCKQLGFLNGYAIVGTYNADLPMLLTSVNCTGTETKLDQCNYPSLDKGTHCPRLTRAAVACSQYDEPIQFRAADIKNGRGRAEIYFDGRWGTICDRYWEDKDADMFCKQIGYLGGIATTLVSRGDNSQPIWMSHVECKGDEKDFLKCRASWDAKTLARCSHYDDAGVKCFKSARLNRGDYRTKQSYGILEINVPSTDPLDQTWFTVCADQFTDIEAEVACRVLGHEHGISTCCSPYGYNTLQVASIQPKCNGSETHITDCEYVNRTSRCDRQNFASVTCYNGTRTQTSYSLALKGSLQYTGQVVLNYLDVPGRICWNNWTDEDARVVCRELGYKNGSAYYHYKSSFIYLDYNGPYWTSNVQCLGNETQLSDCKHEGFGNVTQCNDRGHFAGVICFDETGTHLSIHLLKLNFEEWLPESTVEATHT
ncbi:CD5 molecule-like [Mactra antiquata]